MSQQVTVSGQLNYPCPETCYWWLAAMTLSGMRWSRLMPVKACEIGDGRRGDQGLGDSRRTIGMNALLVKPVIVEIYKYRRNRHNFKDTHHPQF